MLNGQLSIFEYEAKENEITKLQQETIDNVLETNTGCEVINYKNGVVGVIADYEPKEIIPQGDYSKRFNPKWSRQTYLIRKDGKILGIAVGEVRTQI